MQIFRIYKYRFPLFLLLFVDMMLRLDQNEFARDELLQVCRKYYSKDPIELKKIDEFDHVYHAKDAIKWYTNDGFLYRLINHSLRMENIDVILNTYQDYAKKEYLSSLKHKITLSKRFHDFVYSENTSFEISVNKKNR